MNVIILIRIISYSSLLTLLVMLDLFSFLFVFSSNSIRHILLTLLIQIHTIFLYTYYTLLSISACSNTSKNYYTNSLNILMIHNGLIYVIHH